jgi:hypothetical protein|tara:strand:+ start:900 stop:1763 length:864 start_codon:yes stop_codon:yes gene_type:complete
MNHPAELALHQYMEDAVNGRSKMSEETINQVASDIKDALHRQFGSSQPRGDFSLRMSNIGRPTCQLWFAKNKPEKALPKPTTFIMNMMLGDIVEAVFKGLLVEAKVDYTESERVSLELDNDTTINGTYDLIIDGAVDDVKSASDWSYRNKFESFETLRDGDSFGYVGQLAGYAKACDKKAGGWWVVNKANGQFKYVPATNIDMKEELQKIQDTVNTVEKNEFKRCFEPEVETFRGKPTGNTVLNKNCIFCDFRYECWDTLQELPAQASQAKQPKMVQYISLATESVA